MNRTTVASLALLLTTAATAAQAQQTGTSPIQLALFDPVQVVSADKAITGFRLDILYGRNAYVVGLDVGLVNRSTSGVSKGLQYGLVNLVDGSFQGWQDGGVNITKGVFEGLQTGIVNSTTSGHGMQWGGVNVSNDFHGLQLSIVNYARRIHGVQVGLVNIIKEGGAFPVFPIANWSFEEN